MSNKLTHQLLSFWLRILLTFKEDIISRNKRIVSTVLRNINFTNKALSLIVCISISTIKRWKRKILNENGKIDISHKNMGNQNAKKYNDELIMQLGKTYEKNAKITGEILKIKVVHI